MRENLLLKIASRTRFHNSLPELASRELASRTCFENWLRENSLPEFAARSNSLPELASRNSLPDLLPELASRSLIDIFRENDTLCYAQRWYLEMVMVAL
jgi:hypothetical protein